MRLVIEEDRETIGRYGHIRPVRIPDHRRCLVMCPGTVPPHRGRLVSSLRRRPPRGQAVRLARSLGITVLLSVGSVACGSASPDGPAAVRPVASSDTALAGGAPVGPGTRSSPALLCGDTESWRRDDSATPPRMLNRESLLAALARMWGGAGAERLEALVTMRITRDGEVDRACLRESSGSAVFDSAAVRFAYRLESRPGTTGGRPRSVVVSVPFHNGVEAEAPPVAAPPDAAAEVPPMTPRVDAPVSEASAADPGPPNPGIEAAGGPDAADFALDCRNAGTWAVDGAPTEPGLLNGGEMVAGLIRHFRGTPRRTLRTVLRMRVTRGGSVDRACVAESSGEEAFDRAVLELAPLLRFRPATVDGEPRSVVLRMPFAAEIQDRQG